MSIESPGNQRTEGKAEPLLSAFAHDADGLGSDVLSVAVIGPEHQGRKAVAKAVSGFHGGAVREFSSYPELDDLPKLLRSEFEVVIVELDTNPEHALDLVEHICGLVSATVMVYSAHTDSELLVRCMRAGAREFLTHPIAPSTIAEAMVRAAVRRPAHRSAKQTGGKLLMFIGAKGGSGVSTLAANFAVALTQELTPAHRVARPQSSPGKHRDRSGTDRTAFRSRCSEEFRPFGLTFPFHRHDQAQLRAVRAGGSRSLFAARC